MEKAMYEIFHRACTVVWQVEGDNYKRIIQENQQESNKECRTVTFHAIIQSFRYSEI